MSFDRTDFVDVLAVIRDFAENHLQDAPVDFSGAVSGTPLPSLAGDLVEMGEGNPLPWLCEAIEAVAGRSASWGFALASRYSAQLLDSGASEGNGFLAVGKSADGRIHAPAAPIRAGDLASLVVLLPNGLLHEVTDARLSDAQPRRTGLGDAGLAAVEGAEGRQVGEGPVAAAAYEVLLGAVAVGVSRSLLHDAAEYTVVRQQFGQSISTFSGLRAVLGIRGAELEQVRVAVLSAAAAPVDGAEAASRAADHLLDSAIDGVQALGGYGYIDEYPMAAKFRDAISLRARTTQAQTAWRKAAQKVYAGHGAP